MEMWFSEFHTPDVKHSIRVNRQLYSKQSDYQRIDIFETPEFGRVLTLDGNVMLTERDEFIYDEIQDGAVSLDAEQQKDLDDLYDELTDGKDQLNSVMRILSRNHFVGRV